MRGNRGKGWEAALVTQHALYRKDGRAVIFKAEPGIRGGHLQKAPPDFFGVLMGGRGVLFDAKDCAGPRWAFSNLKRHQAVALDAWAYRDGLAGIALRTAAGCWWVQWPRVAELWWSWRTPSVQSPRASIDTGWLLTNARRMNGADWLAVAL
jgi:penicillin-binding protein-related factor A (putative recombinase)